MTQVTKSTKPRMESSKPKRSTAIDDRTATDEKLKTNTQQLSAIGGFVQDAPVYFRKGQNVIAGLKIDTARITGRQLEIGGWCAGGIDVQLLCNDRPLEQKITRGSRPDVAGALKWTEPKDGFGIRFTARCPKAANKNYALQVHVNEGQKTRLFQYPLTLERVVIPGENSPDAIHAVGHLEAAAASVLTQDAVVVGWVVHTTDTTVWLENEDGNRYPLNNAFRIARQDVLDAHGSSFGHHAREAGFILRLTDMMPGEKIRLVAMSGDESITLSTTECSSLGVTPAAAARWLFGLAVPLSQMQKRLPIIDGPVIDMLLHSEQQSWAELPLQARQLGSPTANPQVSVIIPIYGRSDFVEHQLIEFSRDPWFTQNAELIYVLDDPKLTDTFPLLAENLYRLYRLPFKWVWGSVNRGFSGANNLGADQAKGKHFLFLNSDVFPQQPGWLQPLLSVLDDHSEIGAVGPRLVFADGSIQHAGIEFIRREELGIWANHHPYMGLDPTLDPAHELTIAPAVTGACLAIRRSDFKRIGGWDTGYLIGDFEDSDLCLKLRAEGLTIAYLPTVQLTHLERQTFKLLGHGDFRNRVVIYNAVRHQNRWQHLIEELANDHG